MDVASLTIFSVRQGLLQKKFSATELAQAFLGKIREKEQDIHAFLAVSEELALSQALEIDRKISKGESLPELAGVPISVKDAILVEGLVCTAGSRMLEHYIAPYDATVIQKAKEAGAVILGKTNMDEFGMGSSTENSAFGPTKNPRDLTRVPGGTSGGSAASVASEEALVSLGEDTGGSIRLPAAFCGVVGIKPTYGAVSRHGVIAVASSLDQVGTMGKTVEDARKLFEVICGKDPKDGTSVEQRERPTAKTSLKDITIGVPKEYFEAGLDKKVGDLVKKGIRLMEQGGAHVVEISLPHTQYALASYYVIDMSEISANLARYDGLRYGKHVAKGKLLEEYEESRGQGFGEEVKRRIMLGTYALSAGYYDAFYLKAQKVRTLLKQDFEKAFEKVDVVAGPVAPFLPFKLGERSADPLAMYLADIYTVPVNLTGLPAISLPAGTVEGLPVGLQLIGKPFCEQTLFETGALFEEIQS
ncbi:MAG: Asp-tRNA(Asn)/Glu-tRNA(Gln) amidotransferase subunit GatA [bacterium]|nr:Asp-tRNA(Asn)/Glu-tRNA(Gln) amidotransferase subunit GatA [bacterium]